jgi:hypothetical protein
VAQLYYFHVTSTGTCLSAKYVTDFVLIGYRTGSGFLIGGVGRTKIKNLEVGGRGWGGTPLIVPRGERSRSETGKETSTRQTVSCFF